MGKGALDIRLQVSPYEGEEDYIFISYSHKDTDLVLPVLRHLREHGVRFWYDEGIDPGSEWPESIAMHLNGCRACLAFVSPDSLGSPNCRREVNYALSKDKEFLSVILKPVEMSPGMEMQLSSYQSIIRYKYPDDGLFLDKLLDVEFIMNCRSGDGGEPERGSRQEMRSAGGEPERGNHQELPAAGGGARNGDPSKLALAGAVIGILNYVLVVLVPLLAIPGCIFGTVCGAMGLKSGRKMLPVAALVMNGILLALFLGAVLMALVE